MSRKTSEQIKASSRWQHTSLEETNYLDAIPQKSLGNHTTIHDVTKTFHWITRESRTYHQRSSIKVARNIEVQKGEQVWYMCVQCLLHHKCTNTTLRLHKKIICSNEYSINCPSWTCIFSKLTDKMHLFDLTAKYVQYLRFSHGMRSPCYFPVTYISPSATLT